jgi:hypothetical protein
MPSVCLKIQIMMYWVTLWFKTATKLGLEYNLMFHRYLTPQIKCSLLEEKIGFFSEWFISH